MDCIGPVVVVEQQRGTVEVGVTAWEMAQWEIHFLRGMLGALLTDRQVEARRACETRERYQQEMQRALRDREFRRNTGGSDVL